MKSTEYILSTSGKIDLATVYILYSIWAGQRYSMIGLDLPNYNAYCVCNLISDSWYIYRRTNANVAQRLLSQK